MPSIKELRNVVAVIVRWVLRPKKVSKRYFVFYNIYIYTLIPSHVLGIRIPYVNPFVLMVPEKVVAAETEDPDAFDDEDDDDDDESDEQSEDQEIPTETSGEIIGQEIPGQDVAPSAMVLSGPAIDEPILSNDQPQPSEPAASPQETQETRRQKLEGLIAEADAEGQDQGGLKMLEGHIWLHS